MNSVGRKPKYIVQVEGHGVTRWVKYTSKFGPYHGNIRLTSDREEARMWSREGDAERAARVGAERSGLGGYQADKLKYEGCTWVAVVK